MASDILLDVKVKIICRFERMIAICQRHVQAATESKCVARVRALLLAAEGEVFFGGGVRNIFFGGGHEINKKANKTLTRS